MELFGKEINFDNTKIKSLITIGFGIGIIFLIYFLVIAPIKRISSKKKELEKVKIERTSTDQDLKLLIKRYDESQLELDKQQNKLDELLKRYNSQKLEDEAQLKKMIQEILNNLDIELLEIGKTEVEEIKDKIEYKKKMIPYKISGNGRDIALFFYYLENSKFLLTLKNSRLEATSRVFDESSEKNKDIEVKFKVGYYEVFSKELKELDEIKEDKKSTQIKKDKNPLSDYISDGVYEKGRIIFYKKDKNMFTQDYREFKNYVEENFKVKMLTTQGGISSAVLYYSGENKIRRIIVKGQKKIKIGEKTYYIKVFKDRVEINLGKNSQSISLYLRERW